MGIVLLGSALGLVFTLLHTPIFAADITVIVSSQDPEEFEPQVIQVWAGNLVAWENRDSLMVHSIVMQGRTPTTLEVNTDIAPEQTFAYEFDRPGRYPYFCGIHSGMWGFVVVRARGEQTR